MAGNAEKKNPFAATFEEELAGISNTGKPRPSRRHRAVEGDGEADTEFACTDGKKEKTVAKDIDDLTRLTRTLIADSRFDSKKRARKEEEEDDLTRLSGTSGSAYSSIRTEWWQEGSVKKEA